MRTIKWMTERIWPFTCFIRAKDRNEQEVWLSVVSVRRKGDQGKPLSALQRTHEDVPTKVDSLTPNCPA